MPGLVLKTGISARGSANYTPMTPAAASAPSAGNTSIGTLAYGVSGDGTTNDSKTAGYGSVAVGTIAAALLVYIWWSLPR